MHVPLLGHPSLLRHAFAWKYVSAMAFVGTSVAIASLWRVAARVRTRRNAEKLSWKREVSESKVIGALACVSGRIYFIHSNE